MELGGSVVIFVCAFDPIGEGRRVYTVRPAVMESGRAYEDGTLRVFFNASGAARGGAGGGEASRLDAFLSYVDSGGTMGDEWVARLDGEVRAMNADRGWRDTMLGIALDIQEEKYEAREQGKAEGRAEGLAEGLAKEAETNRRLTQALIDRSRVDELAGAMMDPEAKARLLAEFGIE